MGIIITVAAAVACPHTIPLSVMNPVTAMGRVFARVLAKIAVKIKAFQVAINSIIAVAVIPGAAKGKTILKRETLF